MTFADRLVRIGACRKAVRWVRKHRYGLKTAWMRCRDPGWAMWFAWSVSGLPGWPSRDRCSGIDRAADEAGDRGYVATYSHRQADAATLSVWQKLYKLGPVEEIGR